MQIKFLLLLWAVHFQTTRSQESSGQQLPKNLIEIDPSNFLSNIQNSSWVVLHYSPSCPHCVNYMPFFLKFAENQIANTGSSPRMKVGRINCQNFYSSLCGPLEITGYPTLLIFTHNKRVKYTADRNDEDAIKLAFDETVKQKGSNGGAIFEWDTDQWKLVGGNKGVLDQTGRMNETTAATVEPANSDPPSSAQGQKEVD